MTKKTEPVPSVEGEIPHLPPGVLVSVSLREMRAPQDAAPESLLGERVRYARNSLKLNIEALSRLTKEYDPQGNGLSPTSIARYESGESLPGVREFRILVEALDVPQAWLLYGDPTEPGDRVELSQGERFIVQGFRTMLAEQAADALIVDRAVHVDSLKFDIRTAKLARARKPAND